MFQQPGIPVADQPPAGRQTAGGGEEQPDRASEEGGYHHHPHRGYRCGGARPSTDHPHPRSAGPPAGM